MVTPVADVARYPVWNRLAPHGSIETFLTRDEIARLVEAREVSK